MGNGIGKSAKGIGRASGLVLVLLVLLVAISAWAGPSKSLKMTLRNVVPRPRLDSPIGVDILLDWNGSGLINGRLRLEMYEGRRFLGSFSSDDLALTTGQQMRSFLLPAITIRDNRNQIVAKATFVSDEATYDLGDHPLFVSGLERREQVILMSIPRQVAQAKSTKVARALRMEEYDPHKIKPEQRTLSTSIVYQLAEELPASALSYCSYNVVLLQEEGFSMLTKRQLDAIGKWVRGGGSLLVVTGSQTYKQQHLDFIRLLVGDDAVKYSLDDKGLIVRQGDGKVRSYYSGVGRVSVMIGLPEADDFNGGDWRRAVGLLWRLHEDRLNSLVASGKWFRKSEYDKIKEKEMNSGYGVFGNRYSYYDLSDIFDYRRDYIQVGKSVVSLLLPKASRLIPFWMIIAILTIFVVLVGPVDYFVLGRLKLRRLTWITFPVLSIITGALLIFLSDIHMGTSSYRNTFTIHDLDTNGRIVRSNAFEMLFSARERTYDVARDRLIFCPVDYRVNLEENPLPTRSDIVTVSGRFPTNYHTHQDVKQWSPELNRVLSFGNEGQTVPFDIPAKQNLFTSAGRKSFFDNLHWRPAQGGIYVFSYRGGVQETILADRNTTENNKILTIVSLLSYHRKAKGFFRIASGVAPSGSEDCEDLTVLDGNPDHVMVVFIVRDGQDITVYRMLYRQG